MRRKGKEVVADIVLLEHTHELFKEEKNGRILMNPGSISKPILRDRCIGFIEIDNQRNLKRTVHF